MHPRPSAASVARAVFVSLCVGVFAHGATLTFTNRAAFESAVTGETNITFEGNYAAWHYVGGGLTIGDVGFAGPTTYGSPYLYLGESSTNNYGAYHGLNTGDFLLGEGRGQIVMTSLGGGFSALGFDFSLAEAGLSGTAGYTVSLSNGTVLGGSVALGQKQFIGVIVDSVVSSISFSNSTGARPPQLIIDNVTYLTGPSPVPDSGSTVGLALFPLLVLGIFRRRSQAS